MALTPEEVKELKSQLMEQVKDLPEDKRSAAIKQIDSLSPEALESMVKQQQTGNGSQKGIFRMIADHDVPSRIIEETSLAIAVLDIKPISPGHIIIIPKKSVSDIKLLPLKCFNLAKKLAKRISLKLKSKGSEIQTEFKFGEVIINLIPVYDKPLSLQSPRTNPSDKELDSLYQQLRVIKKSPVKRIKRPAVAKDSKAIQLPRRIP